MIKTSTRTLAENLKVCTLFSCISNENLLMLAENYCIEKSYKKGSRIITSKNDKSYMGVVLKGTVQLRQGKHIIRSLEKLEVFSAERLYADCINSTEFYSGTDCVIVLVEKEGIDIILSKSPKFAKKYIEYLSYSIGFLNDKIEGFLTLDAKEKLYMYLTSLAVDNSVVINAKMTELANTLCLSRASLYRAFEELEEIGKISKNGKNIIILK